MTIKNFTIALGVIFLVIGIWGMLSGGHNHELIIFGINTTHNMVHLLSGILAIVAAMAGKAKLYCLLFGAVYGVVTIAGFLGVPYVVNMLNLNMADNFLHLAISGSCLYFGLKAA